MILPVSQTRTRKVTQRSLHGLGDLGDTNLLQLVAYGIAGWFLWSAFMKGRK